MTSISKLMGELVLYGIRKGLVHEEDKIYVTNRLMELFGTAEYTEKITDEERPLNIILDEMTDYAVSEGLIESDTINNRDLFDTKVMGIITPFPSEVRRVFEEKRTISSKCATDYYYDFSKATNYIRTDRIARDEKWMTDTEYGPIDITINLSKPEKDPRDIARAGAMKSTGYPACLLCKENEGFAGHALHPARQNHRIIPIKLAGQNYFMQYSPYVYYNEHCIIFNKEHVPMKIDRDVFEKLLDFVGQFSHYMIGSNADLPIVGGSILSHDHFQGGNYTFAMAKAETEREFTVTGFEDVKTQIIKWPMSVIRLSGEEPERIVELAEYILESWRNYTDEDVFIYAQTEGVPHNTVTPIARMRDGKYELDLVLRNNITTDDKPWGVYHPTEDLHHIKKENIGLIEVMGLAILPSRLKNEMEQLADAILNSKDIRSISEIEKHADWVETWIGKYDVTSENITSILHDEISKVFIKVLECAGVYKRTPEGMKAFERFTDSL